MPLEFKSPFAITPQSTFVLVVGGPDQRIYKNLACCTRSETTGSSTTSVEIARNGGGTEGDVTVRLCISALVGKRKRLRVFRQKIRVAATGLPAPLPAQSLAFSLPGCLQSIKASATSTLPADNGMFVELILDSLAQGTTSLVCCSSSSSSSCSSSSTSSDNCKRRGGNCSTN